MAATATKGKRGGKATKRARRATPGTYFQPAGREGPTRPWYVRFVDPRTARRPES